MKNFVIICLLFFPFMMSCNQKVQKQLEMRVDSLQNVLLQQNTDMNELTSFLDVIAIGIDSITERENMIYWGQDEVTGKKITRSEMRTRIQDLADLIARQRERLEVLQDSISFLEGNKMERLNTIIVSLHKQLDEKDRTINSLKAELETNKKDMLKIKQKIDELSVKNKSLKQQVKIQDETLITQGEMMNEGYYIVATRKELKEKGILVGNGFLTKTKLNLTAEIMDEFNKIDVREFKELILETSKCKVLTDMPESSYSILEEGTKRVKLVVSNPADFWYSSRVLVIQIK